MKTFLIAASMLMPVMASATGAASIEAAPDTIAVNQDTFDKLDIYSGEQSPPFRYKAEAMVATSSGHTPFWLLNNRMGLSSLQQNNGYLRGAFFRDMDRSGRFSWGAGVDLAVPWHFSSKFVIQQLYGEVRYRSFELTVGAKERYMGLVNSELGSGDMTFSQNARPVPQVFLSMPRYQSVPLTSHWLAVKGYFSMGMATDWRWQRHHAGPDGRWVEKLLFHSKGLFLRVGDPDRHPVTFEGGLEMGTHFGGTVHYVDEKTGERKVSHLPHGFKDILKAIIPSSGGNGDDPLQDGEQTNVYGNHVGQWSAAVTVTPPGGGWSFRSYYQHYFEDHSMMFFDHAWRDMLVGLEVTFPKNRFVDTFVYEYLTTKDQSGAVYWDHTESIPEQVSGRDDYYNNYLYPGWSHWGMGMGNPLLISPVYNADGSLSFKHNRVKGHHFGWKGNPSKELAYKVLMSYTRSWGTYANPLPKVLHNFNVLIETTYSPVRMPHWKFRLGLAADGGRLLGKSYGAMLTISKTGWLRK